MDKFNKSLGFDRRFWREDIQGSQAYAWHLAEADVITDEEASELSQGLAQVAEEWEEGNFKDVEGDEDIHTANERRLQELIGPVARKLHTGRSRNDQVATDLHLWARRKMEGLSAQVLDLILAMADLGSREIKTLMPGYTHLQRAQPVRFSHWLLSHAWPLKRDLERLREIIRRHDVCPLGSGALAGNPFNVDRHALAKELGFSRPTPNSMDATANRDLVAELLSWSALTMTHLSRLAEDMIIYSSKEFGYLTLADAYSTGSSLMPQKKNADSLELIRGKTGRVLGQATGFLTTLKGIPSCYNKDLQEDKEPLFDCVDTMEAILRITTGVISTVNVHHEPMLAALDDEMLATDVAYYLVRKGMPFRDAHEKAGEVVALAEKKKIPMRELSPGDLASISELFAEDAKHIWNFANSADQYQAYGGTGEKAVRKQIDELKKVSNKLVTDNKT